jgi:hypothetical protein
MRLPELRRLVTSALLESAACGQLAADVATHRQPYLLAGRRAVPLPSRTARLFTREVNRGHLIVTDTEADQPAFDGGAVLMVTTVNGGSSR